MCVAGMVLCQLLPAQHTLAAISIIFATHASSATFYSTITGQAAASIGRRPGTIAQPFKPYLQARTHLTFVLPLTSSALLVLCHRSSTFLFGAPTISEAYRIAHALWDDGDEGAALLLQSRASELFAVDIHPMATLGAGVMLDHGTGVVIGSTAVIGDDVYMLHGVTLGATGKPVPRGSKRHPTLGRGCTVGANATVLGDIVVGDGATVGAGATVTKAVPPFSTVVGVNSVRGAAPRAKL